MLHFQISFILAFVLFAPLAVSATASAVSNDQVGWKTEYIVGRFLNADPAEGDKIFKFQYMITNGTVGKFDIVRELKNNVLSQGVDIKINSSDTATLEIKVPRNFPYSNSPANFPSGIDSFVLLSEGGGHIEHTSNTTECFFEFSIPVKNNMDMTLAMSSILDKSPYHGDKVPDQCLSETVVENLRIKPNGTIRPSDQVSAGVAPQDVLCRTGFELILNPAGKPYCATEETITFLEKVWLG